MITRPVFVVENVTEYSTIRQSNRRKPCSTSTAVWNPRGPRPTLRSYWSVQIHATRKELTAHEREGEYTRTGTSTRTLQNNRLNCRIQPLHVGMQTPGHFSAVFFRNRTWKPHFLSFVENLNGVVVVFKQYISAVVVRNPFGLRYRDAHDHLF